MPHLLHLLCLTPSAKANGMPTQSSKSGSYFVGVPNSLRHQRHETANTFDLPFEDSLPQDISSMVWGLKDGVAFVRYKTVGAKARLDLVD